MRDKEIESLEHIINKMNQFLYPIGKSYKINK